MKTKTLKIQSIYEINEALDLYVRILCGQYDKLMSFYHIEKGTSNEEKLRELFLSLRRICLPQLNENDLCVSLGIWNPKTPKEAVRAYDIHQILYYQIAYQHLLQEDITKDLKIPTPSIHGEWIMGNKDKDSIYKAIQSFQYPDYFPKGIYKKGWDCPLVIISFDEEKQTATLLRNPFYIDITFNKALCFYRAIKKGDLEKAFLPLYQNMEEKDKKRMIDYIKLIIFYIELNS